MNDIMKVKPNINLPAHLRADVEAGADFGLGDLARFVRPPLLKMIQKQASDELLAKYKTGDTIVTPAMDLIAARGTPFLFVPLFFYSEVMTWAPIEAKGKCPAILDRTTDKSSPLYRKAQSKDTWSEKIKHPDAGEITVRHVEHLNYVVALYNHQLSGEAMIMGFAKGEWSNGASLANLIKARRAPMYGCVFQAVVDPVKTRSSQGGTWCGWDVNNPDAEDMRWVTDGQEYATYKELNAEFAAHAKAGVLRADFEPDGGLTDPEDREDM